MDDLGAAVLGAVLVGGASRRMGRDKARILIRGRPLAEHVASVLAEVLPEVVMLSREADDTRFPGWPTVADRRPGEGPLAGLETALRHAKGRAVWLAACDLPGLTPELVRHVVGPTDSLDEFVHDRRATARIPVFEGRLQPLAALYAPACLPEVAGALDRGERALHRLLERLRTIRLPLTRELPFYHATLLSNINDPRDLESFKQDSER